MNKIRQAWKEGRPAIAGWLQLSGMLHAEALSSCGYDALVIDLQHSMTDFTAAVAMMTAMEKCGVEPFVRLKWSDQGEIMKLLDGGAYGIIVPMIEDAEQARQFAAALHYPPAGVRSFGPRRPILRYGSEYLGQASESVVSFVMIETKRGLNNLDEILAVDGIDGVFIGPTDLALALGCAPKPDSTEPAVVAAVARIRECAHAVGKRAGIFCGSADAARTRLVEGFDLVSTTPDLVMLMDAARESVRIARKGISH